MRCEMIKLSDNRFGINFFPENKEDQEFIKDFDSNEMTAVDIEFKIKLKDRTSRSLIFLKPKK